MHRLFFLPADDCRLPGRRGIVHGGLRKSRRLPGPSRRRGSDDRLHPHRGRRHFRRSGRARIGRPQPPSAHLAALPGHPRADHLDQSPRNSRSRNHFYDSHLHLYCELVVRPRLGRDQGHCGRWASRSRGNAAAPGSTRSRDSEYLARSAGLRQRLHRHDGCGSGQQRRASVCRTHRPHRAADSYRHYRNPHPHARCDRVSGSRFWNHRHAAGPTRISKRPLFDHRGRGRQGRLLLHNDRFGSAGSGLVREYRLRGFSAPLPRRL